VRYGTATESKAAKAMSGAVLVGDVGQAKRGLVNDCVAQ